MIIISDLSNYTATAWNWAFNGVYWLLIIICAVFKGLEWLIKSLLREVRGI